MERLKCPSPLVGYDLPFFRLSHTTFRRSLAASWDSKRRSLEEDFARKEQELRSEQVPKPSQGMERLVVSESLHPQKKRMDVAFVWVGGDMAINGLHPPKTNIGPYST